MSASEHAAQLAAVAESDRHFQLTAAGQPFSMDAQRSAERASSISEQSSAAANSSVFSAAHAGLDSSLHHRRASADLQNQISLSAPPSFAIVSAMCASPSAASVSAVTANNRLTAADRDRPLHPHSFPECYRLNVHNTFVPADNHQEILLAEHQSNTDTHYGKKKPAGKTQPADVLNCSQVKTVNSAAAANNANDDDTGKATTADALVTGKCSSSSAAVAVKERGNSVAVGVKRNKRPTPSLDESIASKTDMMNCAASSASSASASPGPSLPVPEQDKRMRREIANSNERRRMQCINNGFVSLQNILPKNYMKRGEKMSKAAILQSTVDYITKLVTDNQKLQSKNDVLAQKLNSARLDSGGESNDEGISVSEDRCVSTTEASSTAGGTALQWRAKWEQEHYLCTQAYEDIRRLLAQMEYCPAGCAKHIPTAQHQPQQPPNMVQLRHDTAAATAPGAGDLQLPSLPVAVPVEDYLMAVKNVTVPLAMPLLVTANEMDKMAASRVIKVDTYSQFPEPPAPGSPGAAVATEGVKRRVESRRKSSLRCPCGSSTCNVLAERDAMGRRQNLTGFDLLFEAITYSELNAQWDCGRSDSGCSDETVRSAEPPKKRARHTKNSEHRAS
ncbi:uncharacterized protein LOC129590895 isoform X2 [Paramacrobiotus metropolitanus]|uniref:uncharacterized protein LOC129590895 isoform X2 n=1 Tax=Paramacrobiotus metropolitanus TaxID=2943436 RepID=UPI0024459001|nr:uncharacterized protein LOC129590895 isoform X2 [Paramacrobiotus metropolitanus]